MAKKRAKNNAVRFSKNSNDSDRNLKAFITVFLVIIGFILAIILWKKDKRILFYAKESLILFAGFIIASVLQFIPVIGWICTVFMIVLWVITWLYAVQGQEKKTWLVGDLAEKINL